MRCRLLYTAIIFCLVLSASGSVHAETDVERGADAAMKYCSRCHVIGKNEFGGIS